MSRKRSLILYIIFASFVLALAIYIRHSEAFPFVPENCLASTSTSSNTSNLENLEFEFLRTVDERNAYAREIEFSLDEKFLYEASSSHNGVLVWELETGELVQTIELTNARNLALSNDGQRLAAANSRSVQVWNLVTGENLISLPDFSDGINGVRDILFGSDSNTLITASLEGLLIWNLSTGQIIQTMDFPAIGGSEVQVIAANSEKTCLLLGVDIVTDPYVFLVDLKNSSRIELANRATFGGLSFSNDGRLFATSSHRGQVYLFNTLNQQILHTFDDATAPLQIFPNTAILITKQFGANGDSLVFWNLNTYEEISQLNLSCRIDDIRMNNNGSILAVDCSDGIHLWRINN